LTDATTIAVLATFVFLLAGVIKGTVGIGLPTVAVGILSQIIPPHTAIALVVFPLLISNFWQVVRSGAGLETLQRYKLLAGVLFISLWLTTFLTAQVSATLLLGIIGLAMVIFAVTSLAGRQFTISDRRSWRADKHLGAAVGHLSGGAQGRERRVCARYWCVSPDRWRPSDDRILANGLNERSNSPVIHRDDRPHPHRVFNR